MKQYVSILVLVFGVGFFISSCKEDEPVEYWYSYGTYKESGESTSGFTIELDNAIKLIPTKATGVESDLSDGNRVVVVYAIVSETDSTVNAEVTNVSSILTKNVLQLTEATEDSIGNDGVIVTEDNIWFSENHLNVIFTYYYYGKKHFINLVKPIGEQFDEQGNQILEFRHNANDDYMSAVYNGVVSFDMWSLHEEGMDSINFIFKSMDYDSVMFTWKGTYHFNGETPTKGALIGQPEYFKGVY